MPTESPNCNEAQETLGLGFHQLGAVAGGDGAASIAVPVSQAKTLDSTARHYASVLFRFESADRYFREVVFRLIGGLHECYNT